MQFELAPFALPEGYAEAIVPLADVKAHVAELGTDFDDVLAFYRDAAVDMVERYCSVRLGPCAGLVWRGEALPDPVDLGVWPVTAVSALGWLDSTGADVAGTASDWRILRRSVIALKPGRSLPGTVAAGVEITFTAGFVAGECPPALVQAVKMFAAHLFQNREAVVTGTITAEIPLGFRQLCDRVRMPGI